MLNLSYLLADVDDSSGAWMSSTVNDLRLEISQELDMVVRWFDVTFKLRSLHGFFMILLRVLGQGEKSGECISPLPASNEITGTVLTLPNTLRALELGGSAKCPPAPQGTVTGDR